MDVICKHNNDPYYIDNQNFNKKNVLLRLDFNVPMQDGVISYNYRITSAMPTIQRILKDKPNRLMIMSHFGRPNGKEEK